MLLGPSLMKPKPSVSGDSARKTILIFHCEFSAKRAPTLYVVLLVSSPFSSHIYRLSPVVSNICAQRIVLRTIMFTRKSTILKCTFWKAVIASISRNLPIVATLKRTLLWMIHLTWYRAGRTWISSARPNSVATSHTPMEMVLPVNPRSLRNHSQSGIRFLVVARPCFSPRRLQPVLVGQARLGHCLRLRRTEILRRKLMTLTLTLTLVTAPARCRPSPPLCEDRRSVAVFLYGRRRTVQAVCPFTCNSTISHRTILLMSRFFLSQQF